MWTLSPDSAPNQASSYYYEGEPGRRASDSENDRHNRLSNYIMARSSPSSPTRSPNATPGTHSAAGTPRVARRHRIYSLAISNNCHAQMGETSAKSMGWLKRSGLLGRPTTKQLGTLHDLVLAIGGQNMAPGSPNISCASSTAVMTNSYTPSSDYNEKAVRQKTESSLPDNSNGGQLLEPGYPAGVMSPLGNIRRTSSMPSVGVDVSTGERLRHYNYDVKLSKLQKRALRFTWQRLHTRNGGKRVENVFEEVFDRLMKAMPVMRDMFTTRIFLSAISKPMSDGSAQTNAAHNASGGPLSPSCMTSSNGSSATLRDHARLIVRMIDIVIKNLDTDDRRRTDTGSELDPILVGRAHASLRPYGFVSALWEKMGETIIDVVLSQEAVRDLPGAGQAWVVLTACLVDQLRAGFETCREAQQRRLPSSACPFHYAFSTQGKQQGKSVLQQQELNHQLELEQFEAASIAARNLCDCHIAAVPEVEHKRIMPATPQYQHSNQMVQRNSSNSVTSSPSYSPLGSSTALNNSFHPNPQQQYAHRASWCPPSSSPMAYQSNSINKLPNRPPIETNSAEAQNATDRLLSRARSGSNSSRLSAVLAQEYGDESAMSSPGGSRRNSSAEVLLMLNSAAGGSGSGLSRGRHSHHGGVGSSSSSRRSTPERQRMFGRRQQPTPPISSCMVTLAQQESFTSHGSSSQLSVTGGQLQSAAQTPTN
ncbi:globin-like protein 9 [Ditylenchus destructor]|nr:globin-like protein 9 [Ditylenchus destructor]